MSWQEFNNRNPQLPDKPKREIYGAMVIVFIAGFIVGVSVAIGALS